MIYSSSTLFRIYRNTSSGTGNIAFAESIDIARTTGLGASVAVADIDGDGLPDLSLANMLSTNLGVARFATTTYYSRTNGNWNDPNTWSTVCGGSAGTTTPTATDNVIICNTNTVTLTANAACNDLTISAGGIFKPSGFGITVNGNTQVDGTYLDDVTGGSNTFTGTLTVNNGGNFSVTLGINSYTFRGDITNNGSGVIDIGSDIDYTFNPVGTSLTITANGPFGSVTRFSNGGGAGHVFKNVIVAAGASNVDLLGDAVNGLEITAGATLTNQKPIVGNHLQTGLLRGTGTFINTNATLFYNATVAPMVTNGGTFTFGTGDFVGYNGLSNQNVLAGTYNNVRFNGNGSTKTLMGNIVVNGNLDISNGATLDVSASNFAIDYKGGLFDIIGTGSSLNTRSGIVTFSGTTSQTFNNDIGNTTFFNLVINNTATAPNNKVRLTGTAPNGNVIVSNALTLTAGRIELGVKDITYAGTNANLTRTSGWIETNGTGAFVRTGTPAASNNFFVGDATAMRNVILSTFVSPTSVRFTTTITPTITNPTLAIGMWVLNGTGTSTITLQNVGAAPTTSSQIHRSNAGAAWTALTTNAPTLPNFVTTNTITLAADQRFTVFSAPTDYYTLGNANWSVATNWSNTDGGPDCGCSPAGVTNANVRIKTGNTVTVSNAADIGLTNIIDIQGTGVLTLSNGNTNAISTLTTSASSTINVSVGNLTLASPATTTINGIAKAIGSGTVPNGMTFANGSTYEHAKNGGSLPTATWGVSSTCLVTGITTSSPIGLNQTFGNFTWNCPSQNVGFNSGTLTIKGDLVLQNSNGAATGLNNVTLEGNLTNNIGTLFSPLSGVFRFAGTNPQTATGATTFSTLIINNSNNVTLAAGTPFTVSGTLTLTNGRVILGNNNLTYGGTEANLTRTSGWIETNGT
ncbi:MAG: VCBS repeat-containing protein, partial [Cytophagales bacterium]